MLKQVLLDTGFFIDNTYLDQYVALMEKPFLTFGYSELHHKIPAYCYKKKYNLQTRYETAQAADADPKNGLAQLQYSDHIKAHWLLSKCSLSKENEFAVMQMILKIIDKTSIKKTNGEILSEGLTEAEYQEIENLRADLVECSDYYWSSWEESWLKANYTKYSRAYCAQYLDKTVASIHRKAMTLKLTRPSTKWTAAEDTWLRINYPKFNLDACVEYLNRSYNAVIARLSKLSIPLNETIDKSKTVSTQHSRHRWTKEEEQWLLENYTTFGIVGCAEKLGVAQSAIDHKIHRLRKA